MKNIRNFCIIAHINHGKSTIADRILEYTKTIPKKNKAQVLDNMDLERERGITIKSHAVQMKYSLLGKEYIINLIDTPGHTDFSHEVSRAIISCEGAILIIDGSQGIQSQTMSNLYLALNQKLKIIPVINKIDLVNEKIESIKSEIIEILKCKKEDIILASAKNGIGTKEIIEKIIKKIPPPSGSINSPLEAIIFDSMYNPFKGVEIYFKVINGIIKKNEKIKFISTNKIYNVEEVGILKIKKQEKSYIESGNIGYLICKIKNTKDIKIGDTIT
ncbi:MAG: GTP-binding protein, partial [Cytophagales bacterium]